MITYETQIVAMLQALFCGGIAFMIAFKYKREGSRYHFIPSLCAFGLASLFGQQWLSIVGRIMMYGEWPVVSIYNTFIFGILFVLITRAKGNVSRMFSF
jgi:hypothetical protein